MVSITHLTPLAPHTLQVFNNGHTIQVQWAPGTVKSTVMVPAAGE
jgi:hypothetical protein